MNGRIATAILTAATLAAVASSTVSAGATGTTQGELLSENMFLGTQKVEVGARPNGSFGSDVSAPVGYSPRPSQGATTGSLGFRGNPDPDVCAWSDGTCTQGDFFVPGSPYENFAVQVGDSVAVQGFNNESESQIAGTFTSVSPSTPSATWESSGDIGGISVKHMYSLPSSSWVVVDAVTLTNTTESPVSNVYFMRSVDPDNCRTDPARVGPPPPLCTEAGALVSTTYETLNTVAANGADQGKAEVTATQTDGTFLALRMGGASTQAFVADSFPRNGTNLASVYSKSESGFTFGNGQPATYSDSAIGAVRKIDSLAPGEAVTFVVQYILKEGAPAPEPGTPGAPTVVAGDGEVTVTVTPPTDGGTPTSYLVTASGGGGTCTVEDRPEIRGMVLAIPHLVAVEEVE